MKYENGIAVGDVQATVSNYCPESLIDSVRGILGLKTDASLARALGCEPSLLSKVRHQVVAIPATLILTMHETTGIPIRELRHLMGDHGVSLMEFYRWFYRTRTDERMRSSEYW